MVRAYGDHRGIAEPGQRLLRCDEAGDREGAQNEQGHEVHAQPLGEEQHHRDDHDDEHENG